MTESTNHSDEPVTTPVPTDDVQATLADVPTTNPIEGDDDSPIGDVSASSETVLDATDLESNAELNEADDAEPFDDDSVAESEPAPARSKDRSKRRSHEFAEADAFDGDFDADFDSDPSPENHAGSREAGSPATFAPQRLAKILAAAGIDARRKCEEFVLAGRVTVDSEVVTDLAFRADPFSQKIELDGERLKLQRKVYFVLNKPRGVVCTNFDPSGRPRVIDLFPQFKERLFTIGRLDEESEGLLLVTNDGELANRLAHPRYRVPKYYLCHVKGVPSAETLAALKRGMYFEEGRFAVEGVRMKKVAGDSAYLDIVLNEGQNREIRRLMARVDHKVMRLKRVGFGPIRLGDLPSGAFRQLNSAELRLLTDLSQQRAYLDNTAGKSRRKKFGERSGFGGRPKFRGESQYDDRPKFSRSRDDGDGNFSEERAPRGERPRTDRPRGDRPRGDRPQTDRPQTDRPRGGSRPFGQSGYGPKRYGSRPNFSDEQNRSSRPPRRNYVRRGDDESAQFDRDDQGDEAPARPYRGGGRPPRGRSEGDQSYSRGPRRFGQAGPGGNRRRYGQEGEEQSVDRGQRPPRGGNRYGGGGGNRFGGNRGMQRRYQSDDAAENFVTDDGDNDFGGNRRRFFSDDTGEQSFTQRPQRGPRRPPRRDDDRAPRREYGQRGPRRDDQGESRGYRQDRPRRYGSGGPPRDGDRRPQGNRPPRPMTEDGKEILQGRVTGYRSQTNEGPARRRAKAIQGMQFNRQKRQQRRRKTEE